MVLSAAISSFVSFLIFMASSLSLLRKGLFMCLNLADCIIIIISSNSFNSSTGGGFYVHIYIYIYIYIYISSMNGTSRLTFAYRPVSWRL